VVIRGACLSLLLFAAAPAQSEPRCELPGKVEHWVFDACMWEAETDDFAAPAVQACIARTDRQLGRYKPCTQRRILKERLCHRWENTSQQAVRRCVRDPKRTGTTVKNSGL